MSIRINRARVLVLSAGGLIFGASLFFGARVLAQGVPASNAFVYTGFLEYASGEAVDGRTNIGLGVYDQASGGAKVCELDSSTVDVTAGHFTLALPDDCAEAVKEHPDLWVQLSVEGATLARTKLGAVPYAIEAAHATRADTADDASGTLDERLKALEASAGPTSALRAVQGQTQNVSQGLSPRVVFGDVDYDEGGEFNTGASAFISKSGGYYALSCRLYVDSANTAENLWGQAFIQVNGTPVSQGGLYASDYAASYPASAFIKLSPRDEVTCNFTQDTLPSVELTAKGTFEVLLIRGLDE